MGRHYIRMRSLTMRVQDTFIERLDHFFNVGAQLYTM